MSTIALLAGGLIVFLLGVLIGGGVVAWACKGVIDDQQERLDAWEATRWSGLDHSR